MCYPRFPEIILENLIKFTRTKYKIQYKLRNFLENKEEFLITLSDIFANFDKIFKFIIKSWYTL